MHRRRVVAALAGVATAGCVGSFAPDSDDDGVPDGEDAAPDDPRVDRSAGGDPPPDIAVESVEGSDATAAVAVTHEGGEAFTPADTGRLELAAEGESVATLALPFRVGDTRRVEGVPTDQYVAVIWFPPDESADPAVLVRLRLADEQ